MPQNDSRIYRMKWLSGCILPRALGIHHLTGPKASIQYPVDGLDCLGVALFIVVGSFAANIGENQNLLDTLYCGQSGAPVTIRS